MRSRPVAWRSVASGKATGSHEEAPGEAGRRPGASPPQSSVLKKPGSCPHGRVRWTHLEGRIQILISKG